MFHLEVEDFMTNEESWSEQIGMVQRANPRRVSSTNTI